MIGTSFLFALALMQQAGQIKLDIPANLLPPPPKSDQVLAKVNGVEIRASDVDSLLWEWQASGVVNEMITYQMIKADADQHGISLTQEQVLARLKEVEDEVTPQLQGRTFQEFMLEQGVTRAVLFMRLKTDLLLRQLVMRGFKKEQFVKVSTMVFKPASERADDLQRAINQANQAHQRLKSGEKWSDVLKSVMTDQRALASDGLLGWRDLGAFPEQIRTELQTASAGAITAPAQTENGIQIFRLEKRGVDATGDELKELEGLFYTNRSKVYLDNLRKNTKIEQTWPGTSGG